MFNGSCKLITAVKLLSMNGNNELADGCIKL
jgi:hypothetical protein